MVQDFGNEGIEVDDLERRTFASIVARSLKDALT
jgi:hypothetical protein